MHSFETMSTVSVNKGETVGHCFKKAQIILAPIS